MYPSLIVTCPEIIGICLFVLLIGQAVYYRRIIRRKNRSIFHRLKELEQLEHNLHHSLKALDLLGKYVRMFRKKNKSKKDKL